MARLASFNIFWFPQHAKPKNQRTAVDEKLICRVLERLDAHAIFFQEILDTGALAAMLEGHFGARYRVVEGTPAAAGAMRVVAAIDEAALELLGSSSLEPDAVPDGFGGARAPLILHLRDRSSGKELRAVGTHLMSGLPSHPDEAKDAVRRWECENLAKWAKAHTDVPCFVLGDFNLVPAHASFAPLQGPGSPLELLPSTCRLGPDGQSEEVEPYERWSTLYDRVVIDHVLHAGAEAWLTGPATVYAFDLDPFFAEPAAPDGTPFFRIEDGSGVKLVPIGGAPYQEVRAMYRVSDHRPVFVDVVFA